MFSVIPQTWPLRKDGVAQDVDPEWLPRRCPACGTGAVIGHGRRWRQAHDRQHDTIRIRRGRCKQCRITITVLPAWLLPGTQYGLAARHEAVRRYVNEQQSLERSAPDTHSARIADASTVGRWIRRRLGSWWTCLRQAIFLTPTIFAWDWPAAGRILIPEDKPA